jgi:hypothetical protein
VAIEPPTRCGNRGKSRGMSGGSGEDELGQRGDGGCVGDGEACAEVGPKADAELGAGFGEGEEGVATIASEIAAGRNFFAKRIGAGDQIGTSA